jgi:hypothetical protein
MFSQATLFDLVLPRLLAGEPVGAAELAALAWRTPRPRHGLPLPPYRAGQDHGALPG